MSRLPQTPVQTPRKPSRQAHFSTPSSSRIHSSPGTRSPTRRLIGNFNALSVGVDTNTNVDNFVIIELNQQIVRAGFPYQPEPVVEVEIGKVLDTDKLWSNDMLNAVNEADSSRLVDNIEVIMRFIFKRLLVNIKSQRCIVLIPTFFPSPFKTAIADVFLQRLRAASLLFLSKAVCAALSAGTRAALVIEMDHDETIVTPLYDLRELVPQSKCTVGYCRQNQFENDHNDDNELPLDLLISKIYQGLDIDTRGAVINNTIFLTPEYSENQQSVLKELQQKDEKLRFIQSLGAWVGGSLYISSIGWYLVQEDRARLPGECSKERYQSGERWLVD